MDSMTKQVWVIAMNGGVIVAAQRDGLMRRLPIPNCICPVKAEWSKEKSDCVKVSICDRNGIVRQEKLVSFDTEFLDGQVSDLMPIEIKEHSEHGESLIANAAAAGGLFVVFALLAALEGAVFVVFILLAARLIRGY